MRRSRDPERARRSANARGSLQSTPTARANAKRSPAAACLSMANSRGWLSRRGKTQDCTCAQVRGERRGSQRAWASSRAQGQVCSEVSMRARTGDRTNSVCKLQRSLAHAARQNCKFQCGPKVLLLPVVGQAAVSEAVGKIPGGEVALVLCTMAAWRPARIYSLVCMARARSLPNGSERFG